MDDTNSYFEPDNIERLTKIIKELLKVKKWLDCNKLSLNVNKTNFVIFHSPNKLVRDDICIKFGKNRVYTVRESQGEKGLFCFGQGKSGKLAVVRDKITFSFCRSGKSFIFHHQRNMYNTLITR